MTLHLRMPAFLSALALIALGGCSSQPAPTTSTLTGSIAQASFASPVTKITVTNDKGQSTTAAVGAHGEFSITLKQGATYQLFLSDDGKGTPVILNSEKDLVTTVHVKSGGASVDIGSVRFWSGDQSARMRLMAGLTTSSCVNGVIEGTAKPCASGAAAAKCAAEGDDEEEGDNNDGEHADGPDQNDGAQAGGPDQNDGAQAGDASQSILADASQARGIPEHNVTGDLGCGGGDDEDHGGDGEGD